MGEMSEMTRTGVALTAILVVRCFERHNAARCIFNYTAAAELYEAHGEMLGGCALQYEQARQRRQCGGDARLPLEVPRVRFIPSEIVVPSRSPKMSPAFILLVPFVHIIFIQRPRRANFVRVNLNE